VRFLLIFLSLALSGWLARSRVACGIVSPGVGFLNYVLRM